MTEVRCLLGFTNQFCKFIPNYVHIVCPLNELIPGVNSSNKKKPVIWNEVCDIAFNKLKDLCTSTPILAYANHSKEFKLHTDASDKGLRAILYQEGGDSKDHVIPYASHSLSPSEKNYPAHKFKFLALKWSITDQFHEYLYGGTFKVHTDNNPLTYILTTAKLDATGHRWIASLANYTFSLHYKSGKANVEANALSCIDHDTDQNYIDAETAKAIANAVQFHDLTEFNEHPNLVICKSACPMPRWFTNEKWKEEQKNDEDISYIIDLLRGKEVSKTPVSKNVRLCYKERPNLFFTVSYYIGRQNLPLMTPSIYNLYYLQITDSRH